MKQCPKCGNSYTDDTLRFCLEDGTPLVANDEQPTVFRSGDPNKTVQLPSNITAQPGMRVDIPTSHQHAAQPTQQVESKSSSSVIKIVLAVIAIGFVLILGAGVLGGIFYFYTGNQVAVSSSPTPVPSPQGTPWSVASPSPDDDEAKLNDAIEQLKKQIEEATNTSSDGEDVPFGIGRTATVNSPKDGFLALRNLPSSDMGERIAKIPHGTKISVMTCSPQATTIAGKSGHWCMTTYDKKSGWVFDVWLTFDPKN